VTSEPTVVDITMLKMIKVYINVSSDNNYDDTDNDDDDDFVVDDDEDKDDTEGYE
jgi:hypothetical protein